MKGEEVEAALQNECLWSVSRLAAMEVHGARLQTVAAR